MRKPKRVGAPLTERERDVLRLVATGRINKQVAGELGIAQGTVEIHTQNIREKLGANGIAQMTLAAVRMGLVTP
jgi:DNA-binding NarL/FixJ family response regulator